MKITKIRSMWPEREDFFLDRKSTGDEYIIIFCHTPVILFADEKEISCESNTFVVFDKYSHQKFKTNNCELLHDWMHLKGDLNELTKNCRIRFSTPYKIENGELITEIFKDLEIEFAKNDCFGDEIIEIKIKELFYRIGRNINSKKQINMKSSALYSARKEIHRKYFCDWNIEKMAKLVHISSSRFYALYRETFGVSPIKDLQMVRIDHAKMLMQTKEKTVKEIAEAVGYKNEYYFIRLFKKTVGLTPKKYSCKLNQKNV